jgi:hypothetical protein
MVESTYYGKPAGRGAHLAGLWPEQGLTVRYGSHRLSGGGFSLPYADITHSLKSEWSRIPVLHCP